MALTNLHQEHFKDLWCLWNYDHRRQPSDASLRAWCEAEGNLDPAQVSSWFTRRRNIAKAEGLLLSKETYDMTVEMRRTKMIKANQAAEATTPQLVDARPDVEEYRSRLIHELCLLKILIPLQNEPTTHTSTLSPTPLATPSLDDEDYRPASTSPPRSSPFSTFGGSAQDPSSTPPSSPSTPEPSEYSMQPRFVSSTTSQRTKENITPATSVHARDRDEPWSPLPPSSPLPASSPSLPQTPYDHRSSSITIWHLEFSPLPSLLAGIASPEEPSPKRRKTPRYLHEEPVDRDFSMEIDALCAGECMSDCESLCRETLWTKGEETHEGFLAPSARINGYATEVDLESIPMEPLMDTYSYTDSDFSSFLPSLSALSDPLNPSYSLEDPFYDSSMTSPASQFMDFITSPLPIAQDDQPALESSSFRLPRYLQLFDSLFHHDGTFHCKLDESQVDAKDVLEYQLGQPFEPIHLNRCDEEDWGFDDEWAPTFDF